MTEPSPSRIQPPLSKWDAKFSLFFMQKLVDSRYLLGEDTAAGALDHLRSHAALFLEQTVSSSKLELSPAEEEKLEQLWVRLLQYHEQKRWPTCLLSSPRDMAAIKVSLASIGSYLMFRTKRRFRDLDFGLDIFALVISATIECFTEKMLDEARNLVNIAENHILQRMNNENIYHSNCDPTEEQVIKFNRCSAELFWCRVFMRYNDGKCDEIFKLLQSMKEDPVELEPQHSEGLSQMCFNVSLDLFEKKCYEEVIVWLKFAYSFAKKSYNAEDCLETAVSLLAACYLELDCINNSSHVLEILDRAETNVVNMELRLQAMVAASWDSRLIAEHVINYFKLKHEETTDGASVKQAADQVFSLLEEAGQHSTIAHLTQLVPWSRSECSDNEIETEGWAIHVRLLCAKYAARTCLSGNDMAKFFEILTEVATWEFENDDESIPELAAAAEKMAVELHNEQRDLDACLRWYDVIIKFVNHREIDWMVVWNAMACALDTAHPSGSEKARELARLIPQFDDWSDPFPLSIRLKLSLLQLRLDEAQNVLLEMENSPEIEWASVEKIVANVAAVLRNEDRSEALLTLLEQATKRCTAPTLKGALLRFVLRFQMELLRNEAWRDGDSKEYLLNAILDTLGRACECCTGLSDNDALLTEIRAWFARTAWNLGRLGGKTSAYFRHHLFKFSYLLFVTEGPEKETALVQAVHAALTAECKRITHVRLLQSSLALIRDRDRSSSEAPCLVRAMEFHALCLLKDWQSAEQLAEECCLSDRRGPDFFESVSCIALEARRSRIRETDAEGRVFTRPRVPQRDRARLANVAAKCLRRALDLSTPRGIDATSAYCRWIVAALFDELPISTVQFELLDGLVPFICAPDHPFASIRWIFTRIWNATLLWPDRGFRRRILRWLERCLKLSVHADRLTILFGQQFALAA